MVPNRGCFLLVMGFALVFGLPSQGESPQAHRNLAVDTDKPARTDVYGVGAVLFTLLTRRPPWPGRTLESILADVTSRVPVIAPAQIRPEVPESVSEVCRKCLSKSPAERYPVLQDVRSALAEASGT